MAIIKVYEESPDPICLFIDFLPRQIWPVVSFLHLQCLKLVQQLTGPYFFELAQFYFELAQLSLNWPNTTVNQMSLV